MSQTHFLTRVMVRDFKSIGCCDVRLGPLTYLVGPNGAGKSNFLDALHFVRDALCMSLDFALNARGGLGEIVRRAVLPLAGFGIRLEFALPGGGSAHYAFRVEAEDGLTRRIRREECVFRGVEFHGGTGAHFVVEDGVVVSSSESTFPALRPDRLALVALSGMTAFRPIYDALSAMSFHNFDPRAMRQLRAPQDGRSLNTTGDNIASVIGHLRALAPESMARIQAYLQSALPTIRRVDRQQVGHMESLEFWQDVDGPSEPWRFTAQQMSDGTLRALGTLTALFQGNRLFEPTVVGIEEPEMAVHPGASATLREALVLASRTTQVIVTSHSPDLLDSAGIGADELLAVISAQGETRIGPVDAGARAVLEQGLFSAGELLRLNQLAPDPEDIARQRGSAA